MTRRQVTSFRIFLYISILLAAFSVKLMASIGDNGYGSAAMFAAIFIIIGGLILLVPISLVPRWYLKTFTKTKFSSLAFFPLTAFIPCFYLIKQSIKKDQKIAPPDNADADFDADKLLEEPKSTLYKTDHSIAVLVTGVWGLVSLAFTLGLIALICNYAVEMIT